MQDGSFTIVVDGPFSARLVTVSYTLPFSDSVPVVDPVLQALFAPSVFIDLSSGC